MTIADRIEAAAARQAEWEAALEAIIAAKVDRFMAEVVTDAAAALDAPALLAAANPFAFTNIMARWKLTVDALMETPAARLAHPALLDEQIIHVLREASIPHEAAEKARDVLTRYRDLGWKKAQARRELRAVLIPKPPPGARENKTSVEWSWYKTRVRTIARTAATRATSLSTLEAGGDRKQWISRRDAGVRDTHVEAHGQTVAADADFTVGGYSMQYPGDVSAPPELTVNCRCVLLMLEADEDVENMPDNMSAALTAAGPVAPWAGPIAYEGVATGDGRMMAPGSLTWGELPIPLRQVIEDQGEHAGAAAVGRIDRIERRADGVIWAEGVFDLGSERGREAARLVEGKITNGVSVDPDEWAFEVRVRQELIDVAEDPAGAGLALADSEGRVTVANVAYDDEMVVFTRVRIRAATLVDIPAFSRARIGLAGEPVTDSLAASAAPLPLIEWFDDPRLSGPTPLTVTDDGRVFGHIAAWSTCHTGFPGQCVPPPRSPSGYAYFHNGTLRVRGPSGVERIKVGKITAGTGHADSGATPIRTLAHYDNTGTTAAYLRAGEDAFGIWVAGVVAAGATPEQIITLETSPPSGDWRNLGQGLDLLAVLCVNTPGFPVQLVASADRDGPLSLVAAGRVWPDRAGLAGSEVAFVRELIAEKRLQRAAVLAGQVRSMRARSKVDSMAKRRGRRGMQMSR